MTNGDTPGNHIAQDVLSGIPARVRPHKPSDSYPPHKIAAEYTRHLLPWARRIVCYGRERNANVRHIRNAPRNGGPQDA